MQMIIPVDAVNEGHLREHTTDLVDESQITSGLVTEIHWWGPVSRLVLSDGAGSAVRGKKLSSSGIWGEAF